MKAYAVAPSHGAAIIVPKMLSTYAFIFSIATLLLFCILMFIILFNANLQCKCAILAKMSSWRNKTLWYIDLWIHFPWDCLWKCIFPGKFSLSSVKCKNNKCLGLSSHILCLAGLVNSAICAVLIRRNTNGSNSSDPTTVHPKPHYHYSKGSHLLPH